MNSRLPSISNKQQVQISDTEKSGVAPIAAPATVMISLSWDFLKPRSEGLRYGLLVYPTAVSLSFPGRPCSLQCYLCSIPTLTVFQDLIMTIKRLILTGFSMFSLLTLFCGILQLFALV